MGVDVDLLLDLSALIIYHAVAFVPSAYVADVAAVPSVGFPWIGTKEVSDEGTDTAFGG